MDDEHVLDLIFHPELRGVDFPTPDELLNEELRKDFSSSKFDKLRELEKKGVKLAEQKDVDGAISAFTQAIELDSTYASAYNNRAQAYQLKGDLDQAMKDLDNSIKFGVGLRDVLSQAHSQRGIILRVRGSDEAARVEFEKAGSLGNKFAQKQAVALNPYAALCNQFLSQAMSQYRPDPQPESGVSVSMPNTSACDVQTQSVCSTMPPTDLGTCSSDSAVTSGALNSNKPVTTNTSSSTTAPSSKQKKNKAKKKKQRAKAKQ